MKRLFSVAVVVMVGMVGIAMPRGGLCLEIHPTRTRRTKRPVMPARRMMHRLV